MKLGDIADVVSVAPLDFRLTNYFVGDISLAGIKPVSHALISRKLALSLTLSEILFC